MNLPQIVSRDEWLVARDTTYVAVSRARSPRSNGSRRAWAGRSPDAARPTGGLGWHPDLNGEGQHLIRHHDKYEV
jgi:hypothetical protein